MIKKRTCQIYFKREGGHHTYFVDRGNNWGGDTAHPPNTFYTLQDIFQTHCRHPQVIQWPFAYAVSVEFELPSLVDGWVGGWLAE